MFDIQCSCGTRFEVQDDQDPAQIACPGCGTTAAELIALAEAQDAPPAPAPLPKLKTTGETPSAAALPAHFKIPCGNHPDQTATHNCLSCAKPICMTCVRERGYYCSDACRNKVQAETPTFTNKARDAELTALANKVDNIGSTIGTIMKKLIAPAVLVVLALAGYWAYKTFFGPRGRLSSSMSVSSQVAYFKAKMIAPGKVVVQANSELFLADIPNQQKEWTTDLAKFEKAYMPPVAHRPTDADFDNALETPSDPLGFSDVQGELILVHSGRQLLAFDAKSGKMRWEYFNEDGSVTPVAMHRAGLLCSVRQSVTNNVQPQLVNFSLVDGAQTWSQTNAAAEGTVANGQLVSMTVEPKPGVNRDTLADEDEEDVPTAGSVVVGRGGNISARDILAAARGKPVAPKMPKTNYIVEFTSLDGRSTNHKMLALAGSPQPHVVGKLLCLAAGNDLVVFDRGPEPLWQATLGGEVSLVSGSGDVIAVVAGQDVVAFEAKSGKQKWTRAGLKTEHIVVSPDGAVYATLMLTKEQANGSEYEKFREAAIGTIGRPMPREGVAVLLKLDAQTGQTRWGVKNIGRDVIVSGDELYCIDRTARMDFVGSQDLTTMEHSVHCLSPANGKDRWTYIAKSELYDFDVQDKKVFLVTSQEGPSGRRNPSCLYQLQIVESK